MRPESLAPKKIAYMFENLLKMHLEDKGCSCVGVTDRYGCGALPDLVCNCGGKVYFIEAKYSNTKPCCQVTRRKLVFLRKVHGGSSISAIVFCYRDCCTWWPVDHVREPERWGRSNKLALCIHKGGNECKPLDRVITEMLTYQPPTSSKHDKNT